MAKKLLIVTGLMVLMLSAAGPVFGQGGLLGSDSLTWILDHLVKRMSTDDLAARKAILYADLKVKVGLSTDQMNQLDALALQHKQAMQDKAAEVKDLVKQLVDLAKDPKTNFDAIIHLEFQLYVKQYEIAQADKAYTEAVAGVLTTDQADYRSLVLHVLGTAN